MGLLAFTHAIACCSEVRRIVVDGKAQKKFGPYPVSLPFAGLHGFQPIPPPVWAFLQRLRDLSIETPLALA